MLAQVIDSMYNLNTKRALVEEGGTIEWISGSFGSHVGCLYPMSILKGDNSRMEFTGVTFAGVGQSLDTGAKVVHVGRNTSSYMNTRSISKSGGISTFRSSVVVEKSAKGAKSSVSCQSLMLDPESRSDTIPAMDIRTKDAAIGHGAKIGAISNEAVFYLMSRGMSEEDARALIVSGFADNVFKKLPVEYAVEMNNLIRLEMKGSIGGKEFGYERNNFDQPAPDPHMEPAGRQRNSPCLGAGRRSGNSADRRRTNRAP